jgi:hypothetical protein
VNHAYAASDERRRDDQLRKVLYCCPNSPEAAPIGVGAVPAAVLPRIRLFPYERVVPETPVPLKVMSLFEIRTVDPAPARMPVAFWLITLSLTVRLPPGSVSTPAAAFPMKADRVAITLLPLPTPMPKLFRLEWVLSIIEITAPVVGAMLIPHCSESRYS